MEKPYRTLLAFGRDEFVVNKSRFLGSATPARTEEEALAFLQRCRAEFPGANHHSYAYVIGRNAGIQRYSDDGEPGGTAGMPILGVIHAQGLVDCAVVVTRFFGGVLLGAGGLTRAYAKGATVGIAAARPADMYPTRLYGIEVAYPQLDRLEHYLKTAPIRRASAEYAEGVTLYVLVRMQDEEGLLEGIARVTDGRAIPVPIDDRYEPWDATRDDPTAPYHNA